MSFSDAVNSATTLVLAVTVKDGEPMRLEVVMVPVILRLDSEPVGGSMAPAVRVYPEAITRLELMVTGEAPMMLDAVKVPVIQESPTTCRGFSGSVVPMPTLDVDEMTKVFWSPTLEVFWGAVMKK